MTTPPPDQLERPWTERLWKFAAKLPRYQAADLAKDLQNFQGEFEEILDAFPDLIDYLETWADDDADKAARAEAKESADQVINELHGFFLALVGKLGTYTGDLNDPAT